MSTDGPYFPEFDLTPEQRLEAAAKILLDAVREMYGERNREKTRRSRARKKTAAVALDDRADQSGHQRQDGSPRSSQSEDQR